MPPESELESEPSVPPQRGIAASIGDIQTATDEALLRSALDRALVSIAAELRAHTPTAAVAAAWSEVLVHGLSAGVRLTAPADWTWFVSGSVARREASPGSDVETMVALDDSLSAADKVELLSRAADVHELIERCGITGDANGVQAGRPRFCRRVSSWTEGIERWSATPREDRGVVMTGLVADSTSLPGSPSLPEDVLRAQIVTAAGRCYPVRQAMLQDATAVRATVPSRLRLFGKTADTVDLKLALLDPVVKIARWAALSAGSGALSTLTRLDDAAGANVLDADDAASLRECFAWLLGLRWRTRATPFFAGESVGDIVSLSEMAPQERAILRSVAREVSGISRKLTYLASASTFR